MSVPTSKRIRVRVTGLVQGVFYRASTKRRADELGVSGWVMNTPNGAVELEAQGSPEAVAQLLVWCRQGPPAARVEQVVSEPMEPILDEPEFRVHYS